MILSGRKIQKHIGSDILIEPYDPKRVNPNSYNLSLHNELLVYTGKTLDMKRENPTERLVIPEEGLVLEPHRLYLGRTNEYMKTERYVPMLEGRSSTGRLGLFIHVTAGFGDIGFAGYWTLEIFCIQPVRIYPDVEIRQIYYHDIDGEYDLYASGKGIMPAEATKAHGIRKLCALRGYDRVVSFGDAVNDLRMFDASDECYAVENAVPELKAAATGVIQSNEADGVAKWLEENWERRD